MLMQMETAMQIFQKYLCGFESKEFKSVKAIKAGTYAK